MRFLVSRLMQFTRETIPRQHQRQDGGLASANFSQLYLADEITSLLSYQQRIVSVINWRSIEYPVRSFRPQKSSHKVAKPFLHSPRSSIPRKLATMAALQLWFKQTHTYFCCGGMPAIQRS